MSKTRFYTCSEFNYKSQTFSFDLTSRLKKNVDFLRPPPSYVKNVDIRYSEIGT